MSGGSRSGAAVRFGTAAMVITAIVIAAFIAVFCIINFVGFPRFALPDMYADTCITQLIWEQKTIFPDGWTFGNQLNIFSTPNIAALFYGLTGSLNTAMAIAVTVQTVIILLLTYWVVKPLKSSCASFAGILVIIGAILGATATVTLQGQILYILTSYYSCYVITLLVVWGDYSRALRERRRRFINPAFLGGILLSFAMGMQSIRQTAVMVIPLAVFEGLRMIALAIKHRCIPKGEEWRVTVRAAAFAISNLAGVAIIRLLGVSQQSMFGDISLTLNGIGERFDTGIRAVLGITGLKYLGIGRTADGETNIALGIFSVLLVVSALYALVRYFVKHDVLAIVPLGFISLAVLFAVNLLIKMVAFRSIYMFVWYPLAAVSVATVCSSLKKYLRPALLFIICIFACINLAVSYIPDAQKALEKDNSVEAEMADWITAHGYDRLYAVWGVASAVAVRTDGKVCGGTWYDGVFRVLPYINPLGIYSEEDNDRAVYIFISGERESALAAAKRRGAQMELLAEFSGGSGSYYIYKSSAQLMYIG